MALVTLVYANIAISWQILSFKSLKKHFPQIYRSKKFENVLEKSSLILAETPVFSDWKKSSKISLISLIGGNLVLWMKLQAVRDF